MVYSILTRSREYSKAIHCTPLLSCRTTRGVVAGMGPGAAVELVPTGVVGEGIGALVVVVVVMGWGGFKMVLCGGVGCWVVGLGIEVAD